MTDRTLDRETALALLHAVVQEAGADYTYQYTQQEIDNLHATEYAEYEVVSDSAINTITCKYQDEQGAPRCIVGHVLAKWDPEGWRKIRVVETNGPASSLSSFFAFDGDPLVTRDAADLLRDAQVEQDQGKTWGWALAAADAAFDR